MILATCEMLRGLIGCIAFKMKILYLDHLMVPGHQEQISALCFRHRSHRHPAYDALPRSSLIPTKSCSC